MSGSTGTLAMAGKKKAPKSETRRHAGVMRVDAETLEVAKLAASLMRMSLADYASRELRRSAERDIDREARKLTERKGRS